MPFLQTDMAQGALANQAIQEAPYQTAYDIQHLQLQKAYDPELFASSAEHQRLDNQVKQLNVQQLQQTLSGDSDSAQAIAGYYKDPQNKGKPLSEAVDYAADQIQSTNPIAALHLRDLAQTYQGDEAKVTEAKGKVEEIQREHLERIVNNLDPKDPSSVAQAIMDAQLHGLDPKQYLSNVTKFGPEVATNMLKESLKTTAERREDARVKAEADLAAYRMAKEDNNVKKLQLASEKELALLQHQSIQEGIALSKMDIDSRKAQQKEIEDKSKVIKSYSASVENYYKDAQQEYNKLLQQYNNTDATPEEKKSITESQSQLTEDLSSNINRLNESAEQDFINNGLDFNKVRVQPGNKSTTAKENTKEISQEDFNSKWSKLKSGESLVGPDGKTYTKK